MATASCETRGGQHQRQVRASTRSTVQVSRSCPKCHKPLAALTVRCACGYTLPESRDLRSDPDQPTCGLCNAPMGLMEQRCPSCGAFGYPALRPRQGKKCKRAGDEALLVEKDD